ncbi:hypothetical protein [Vibrio metschnikovii]|uniref:hypothetical protein n=1 Tax=Vibrio metschnikovii TaxID=28172 RepID=UPI001302E91E|nr:hypothetical protein [Vibrio metschnikovii]
MKLKNANCFLHLCFLFGLLSNTPDSYANDVSCSVDASSTNNLLWLNPSCPIGLGVWSRQKPREANSYLWIQCGFFTQSVAIEKMDNLFSLITHNILFQHDFERQAARCLIGPYIDHVQAFSDLALVQAHPGFELAFLREISVSDVPQDKQESVTIRARSIIGDKEYSIPYINNSDIPFHFERDLKWGRFRYEEARKLCQSLYRRLVTDDEWQQLVSEKIFNTEQWPVELPYWGRGQKGLFINGETRGLNSSSQLNVLCVRRIQTE